MLDCQTLLVWSGSFGRSDTFPLFETLPPLAFCTTETLWVSISMSTSASPEWWPPFEETEFAAGRELPSE